MAIMYNASHTVEFRNSHAIALSSLSLYSHAILNCLIYRHALYRSSITITHIFELVRSKSGEAEFEPIY
jgi:hypothetical protein